MFLGAIFNWREGTSGVSTDSFGLLGLFVLLFGAAIAGVAAVRAFAPQVNLPSNIVGFTLDQVMVVLGFTAFLWTFAGITADGTAFGLHLSWIGAAVATVGSVLTARDSAPAGRTGF